MDMHTDQCHSKTENNIFELLIYFYILKMQMYKILIIY